MTVRIGNIAFDCDDVLNVASFWSTVLERPLDRGSSELFASIGGTDSERREPALYFTRCLSPHAARTASTSTWSTRTQSAIDKLVEGGATVVGKHAIPGHHWTVMQDPEGNEFCIASKSFTGWD